MKKEFYDMRVRILLILIIMMIIFISFGAVQQLPVNSNSAYNEVQEQLSQEYKRLDFSPEEDGWTYYIYSQWFSNTFGLLVPIIAIIIAFPLFSSESENNTLVFLVTRKGRSFTFLNKVFSGLFVLLLLLIFYSVFPIFYSALFSKSFLPDFLPHFSVSILLGGLFWYSITLLFSIIFNDKVKPILASLGILLISTFIGFINKLDFINTYNFIKGREILNSGKFDLIYSLVLLIISMFILSISYLVFKNKDIDI